MTIPAASTYNLTKNPICAGRDKSAGKIKLEIDNVGTYDYNGQSPSPSLTLGCAFRFLFLFGLASFFGILRCPRITSDSVEHTSDLYYSRARLICSGILRNPESGQNPEGRTLESTAYCATLTNIQLAD